MLARRLLAFAPLLVLLACGGTSTAPIPTSDPPAASGASGDGSGAASSNTPPPANPSAPPAGASPATACTWSNMLDRDSFYVVAGALEKCVATPTASGCTRVHSATEDTLTMAGLDEGVGTIQFMYTTVNGSHSLLGSRVVSPTTNETVLTAAGVPAGITLDQALTTLFAAESPEKKAFVCTIAP